MTYTHSWLWHLLNDPMRDNPWLVLILIVLVVLVLVYIWRVR